MSKTRIIKPARADVLRLAADAEVDARTAENFLAGRPIKNLSRVRCERAQAKRSTASQPPPSAA
jgi:hypothetical protein